MEKFLEKFNIFDIFTMLVPGIIISCLLGVSLSFEYYNSWEKWGNEKYFIFFVFSYICGILFQEIGTMLDKAFLDFILYGGNPREIYLENNIKNRFHKVFDNEIVYNDAVKIIEQLKAHIGIIVEECGDRKKLHALLFSYCLNVCEARGWSFKADKMLVVSEMSRSLFLGCVVAFFLNAFLGYYLSYTKERIIFMGFLVISALIFFVRKKRYEKYRISIILRAYKIGMEDDKK